MEFTINYEGGYANNPADRGGETFRGVSRRQWPDWEGWADVDAHRSAHPDPAMFRSALLADDKLTRKVFDFYRKNFWDEIHGDELPGKFAAAVFDMAVHSGPKRAVRVLQCILPGVDIDGQVGPQTVKAAHDAGERGLEDYLAARARFLTDIMANDATQKSWTMNWFRRLFRLANLLFEGTGIEFKQDEVNGK